jgi:pimeloyl-ACP methyl ester carboxylesterase
VRGKGSLLLILPGGHGDADTAEALCQQLVDRYTVVTYDRRGMSRSTIDRPTDTPTIETHSEDVYRLLATLTSHPSLVFGSSISALIGLDLVARYPKQVSVLLAHEPPAFELLPAVERDQAIQLQKEAEAAFQREGVEAGFKRFVALAAVDYNDRESDAPLPPYRNGQRIFRFSSPVTRLQFVVTTSMSARCAPLLRESSRPLEDLRLRARHIEHCCAGVSTRPRHCRISWRSYRLDSSAERVREEAGRDSGQRSSIVHELSS